MFSTNLSILNKSGCLKFGDLANSGPAIFNKLTEGAGAPLFHAIDFG